MKRWYLLLTALLLLVPAALSAAPVVGVLPFEARGDSLTRLFGISEELTALALTETTLADLKGLAFLTLVDRSRMEEVIKEQTLALSGLISEESAVEAGELLGATHLLSAALIFTGPVATFSARITDAETGVLAAAVSLTGPVETIFTLQEEAVEELVLEWDIPLSRKEREALAARDAVTLEGLDRLGRALDARNRGDFEEALPYLTEAVTLNPDFTLAREVKKEVEQRFTSFLEFRATGLPEELTGLIKALPRREPGAAQEFLKRYWALMQPLTMGVSYYGAWAAMPASARPGFFEAGIKSSWAMLGLTRAPEDMEEVTRELGRRLFTARGLLELLIEQNLPLQGYNDFLHPLEGALGAFLTAFSALSGSPEWQFPPMIGPEGEITLPSSGYPALLLRYGDLFLKNFPYSAYAAAVTPVMQTLLEMQSGD